MKVKKILGNKYDVSSFNCGNTFTVILNGKENNVHLDFGDRVVRFNYYEEELSDFDESIQPYFMAIEKEISDTTLIEIIDSPLLKKLFQDTNDFYSMAELKHYVLFTRNYVMEVVGFDKVVLKTEELKFVEVVEVKKKDK